MRGDVATARQGGRRLCARHPDAALQGRADGQAPRCERRPVALDLALCPPAKCSTGSSSAWSHLRSEGSSAAWAACLGGLAVALGQVREKKESGEHPRGRRAAAAAGAGSRGAGRRGAGRGAAGRGRGRAGRGAEAEPEQDVPAQEDDNKADVRLRFSPRTPRRIPPRRTDEMATSTQDWIEELKSISVLELAERIKALEEEFGVSAAAMAAPAAAPARRRRRRRRRRGGATSTVRRASSRPPATRRSRSSRSFAPPRASASKRPRRSSTRLPRPSRRASTARRPTSSSRNSKRPAPPSR